MGLKPFGDKTNAGNEQSFRRGHTVPPDAVNVAYSKAPRLNPADNVIIIDTAHIIAENAIDTTRRRKIYYANSMGILEDENGDQLVQDEFPYITDTFSINEDWSTVPGSEYEPKHMLPFMHVSRYFHLDFSGLTMGDQLLDYPDSRIKVVEENGGLYINEDGSPRYRIRIAAAKINVQDPTRTEWAYRVHVYVDQIPTSNLYLLYNKTELDVNGNFKKRKINHKELLNPKPYFEYRPEESEVVDPFNRNEKFYSTKPLAFKEQILGLPQGNIDGYRVYVPKKAISDPRIFELFHWRLTCNFTQEYEVDETKPKVVKVGVVVTNSIPHSESAYAFLNLERSAYNSAGIKFVNPLKGVGSIDAAISSSDADKENADYWYVNFDTVTGEQLAQFDMLIWSPAAPSFNFAPYKNKLYYFISVLKRFLFFDTTSYTVVEDSQPKTSCGVDPTNGSITSAATVSLKALIASITFDAGKDLISGKTSLGGWNLGPGSLVAQNHNELSISAASKLHSTSKIQYIASYSSDWSPVITTVNENNDNVALVIEKDFIGGGKIIFSTLAMLFSCSALFGYNDPTFVSSNKGATAYRDNLYTLYVSGTNIEACMKFFYNSVLDAVRSKDISNNEETAFSSSWSYSTKWKSDWAINPADGILSRQEIDKYDFSLLPRDPYGATPALDLVWKKRISDKTVQELMDEVLLSDPLTKSRTQGATRTYTLEITNDKIRTDSVIIGESPPYIYTEEISPKFIVPPEIGPHVIKEEELKGAYGSGQYMYRVYPDKPYSAFARISYAKIDETLETSEVNWTATGHAKETVEITRTTPASTTSVESEVTLSWWNNALDGRQFVMWGSDLFPRFGTQRGHGLDIWQEWNYYGSNWGTGNLCWPYWGHNGRYQSGSRGEVVQFIQEALNRFHNAGFFNSGVGLIAVDGDFGSKTVSAIKNFQSTFHARYVDGVVDAETFSLIGYQIIRGGWNDGGSDYRRFFSWPYGWLNPGHISDSDNNSVYAKRSWVANGPSVIWEVFQVILDQTYNIHAVTVVPYLVGQTNTLHVNSIAVRPVAGLTNFNADSSQLTNLPYRPADGEELRIPIGPYSGQAVAVGVSQDGPAGPEFGGARFLGIRDIRVHASVNTTTVTPGSTSVTQQTNIVSITDHGHTNVTSFQDQVIQASPEHSGLTWPALSEIVWTSVSTDNPDVSATITPSGKITLRSSVVDLTEATNYTNGVNLPGGMTYYSKTEDGVISPRKEAGHISKADGIKLFCDINGNPVGFPSLPTDAGANPFIAQYGRLTLISNGSDVNVYMGFWDVVAREFVLNAAGRSEMSIYEYFKRGPHNIFIGAITTYELDSSKLIPTDNDAPKIPYRQAMPVYGVQQSADSRIALEPLPKTLGQFDAWPIQLRNGRFSRDVVIQAQANGHLTDYLKNYQGKKVRAFYAIPESDFGDSSLLYGPPYTDVKHEQPLVTDDRVIQVRQPPILLNTIPTVSPGPADPVRPVFKVETRASIDDSWVELTWPEIADYNVNTGEILLTADIADPELVRVTYTSARKVFSFKRYISGSIDRIINLNIYMKSMNDLIGTPLYVYLLPEYVKDSNDQVITGSVLDRTVNLSTDGHVFNQLDPNYQQLALLIGVVFMSPAFDVKDLVLLDTRRRGGGAPDAMVTSEIVRNVSEASNYWDINYGAGTSYQKSGFIIIRLPAVMKDYFTETEIREVIDRNITIGVDYKIEDLSGMDW